jgi:hypothetical protein
MASPNTQYAGAQIRDYAIRHYMSGPHGFAVARRGVWELLDLIAENEGVVEAAGYAYRMGDEFSTGVEIEFEVVDEAPAPIEAPLPPGPAPAVVAEPAYLFGFMRNRLPTLLGAAFLLGVIAGNVLTALALK